MAVKKSLIKNTWTIMTVIMTVMLLNCQVKMVVMTVMHMTIINFVVMLLNIFINML